jgi:hypothetical protein
MRELEGLPTVPGLTSRDTVGMASIPSALAGRLLDIQMRQFLALLHLCFAQQEDGLSRYDGYSRMVCLSAANAILEHHVRHVESGNWSLVFLRGDIFRAALAMCHSIIPHSMEVYSDFRVCFLSALSYLLRYNYGTCLSKSVVARRRFPGAEPDTAFWSTGGKKQHVAAGGKNSASPRSLR